MARWAPARKDTLSSLADELLHNYAHGRILVAIDGFDGAGKTTFADDLAEILREKGHEVFRASIDDFHRPREARYRLGRESPEGFYRESFDYATFNRVLVEPFRSPQSGAFVTAAFDLKRDAPIEPKWTTAGADAFLIVDGIFLNRPELRGLWNFSVWLDVPASVADQRLVARDGEGAARERYTEGRKLYLAETRPGPQANAIIDNTDVEHPRRVFADSC